MSSSDKLRECRFCGELLELFEGVLVNKRTGGKYCAANEPNGDHEVLSKAEASQMDVREAQTKALPIDKLAEEWDRLDKYYSQLAEVAAGAGYDKGSFVGKSIGFSVCSAQLKAALALATGAQGEVQDDYVAWCRYNNGSIATCDSDAPGAFKVYRWRAAAPPVPGERLREASALHEIAQGCLIALIAHCAGIDPPDEEEERKAIDLIMDALALATGAQPWQAAGGGFQGAPIGLSNTAPVDVSSPNSVVPAEHDADWIEGRYQVPGNVLVEWFNGNPYVRADAYVRATSAAPPVPGERLREAVSTALDRHRWNGLKRTCECGWEPDVNSPKVYDWQYRLHVGEIVASSAPGAGCKGGDKMGKTNPLDARVQAQDTAIETAAVHEEPAVAGQAAPHLRSRLFILQEECKTRWKAFGGENDSRDNPNALVAACYGWCAQEIGALLAASPAQEEASINPPRRSENS